MTNATAAAVAKIRKIAERDATILVKTFDDPSTSAKQWEQQAMAMLAAATPNRDSWTMEKHIEVRQVYLRTAIDECKRMSGF